MVNNEYYYNRYTTTELRTIPFYGKARVIGFKHRIDPEPCLFV